MVMTDEERREKHRLHQKEFRRTHKEYYAQWERENKELRRRYTRERHKKNPWVKHYNHARARCTNKKEHNYSSYGGRGIKCLLTVADTKMLWERDQAHLLTHPSIDRIDVDGNYTIDNCRFIEKSKNVRGKARVCKPLKA